MTRRAVLAAVGGRALVLAPRRPRIALGYDIEVIGGYPGIHPDRYTDGRLTPLIVNALHSLSAAARGAGIPLQFFVLGETLEEHAAPIQELRRAGHAIDQHTYTHLPLVSNDVVRVTSEVRRTNHAMREVLGEPAVGLRAPGMYQEGIAGHDTLQKNLATNGIRFVSTRYRRLANAQPAAIFANFREQQPLKYPSGLIEIPATGYSDQNFLWYQKMSLGQWLDYIEMTLKFAWQEGLLWAPDLHPHTMAQFDPENRTLQLVLSFAREKQAPVITYRGVMEELWKEAV